MNRDILFPPEWHQQSAVQLTWPHQDSDWSYLLDEVNNCFVNITKEIIKHEHLIIVCKDIQSVKSQLGDLDDNGKINFVEITSNDTWARDHGGISVYINGQPTVYDFTFNGWGLKFPANFDNQITKKMFELKAFSRDIERVNKKNFILEGGALETDGRGTLLTTSECLLSPNRNPHLSKAEIETFLKENLGLKRVLWLDYG